MYNLPFLLTTEHPSQNFLTEERTFIVRICSCCSRDDAADCDAVTSDRAVNCEEEEAVGLRGACVEQEQGKGC